MLIANFSFLPLLDNSINHIVVYIKIQKFFKE